jgi:hypothetical protein
VLEAEWPAHSARQRAARRTDVEKVNAVIAATIDAVQDDVLDPAMPVMGWVDVLLGPVDELIVSRLITFWRDEVWQNASHLLDAPDPAGKASIVARCETGALRTGEIISMQDISGWVVH